jgi:hypothetical protein
MTNDILPTTSPATLDHERLDAYRAAVELDRLIAAAARSSTRGAAWLWDQAMRGRIGRPYHR